MESCRLLRQPALLVLLALPSLTADLHGQLGLESAAAKEREGVATLVTGRVQRRDGAAAPNAVVVTNLGGKDVTAADGRFELAFDTPPDALALHVTAVASLHGANHMATVLLQPGVAGTAFDVGTLVLEASAGCTPSMIAMPGVDGSIRALAVFDDGGGPGLYAGGWFTSASGVAVSGIAKWDGSSWLPLGSGMNNLVSALTVFDDGGGEALYAGGEFTTAGGVASNFIAQWDGTSWSPLGSGMDSGVAALTVFDDGGGEALYAGGEFTVAGGVAASFIAQWDGSSWSPLGSGMDSGVFAMTVFDEGGGAALYAGGGFTTAGGVAASGIAQWEGSSWAPLGSGVSGSVLALTVFDDGGGPALYAGGAFTTAGGVAASCIAQWDGSNWSPLGSGVNSWVHDLAVFDAGGGPALYAVGWFPEAGGVIASGIAQWDGTSWSSLGVGMSGKWFLPEVYALAVFDDGGGLALYAGGNFDWAGGPIGVPASDIAKWGCPPPITSLPGCAGNPATLAALATSAPLGAPLPLQITAPAATSGVGIVYLGTPGIDGSGCGLLVPGLGELLLALAPPPFLVASAVLASGTCHLLPLVPNDPVLSGMTVHVQGAALQLLVPQFVELTNALAITLGP